MFSTKTEDISETAARDGRVFTEYSSEQFPSGELTEIVSVDGGDFHRLVLEGAYIKRADSNHDDDDVTVFLTVGDPDENQYDQRRVCVTGGVHSNYDLGQPFDVHSDEEISLAVQQASGDGGILNASIIYRAEDQ